MIYTLLISSWSCWSS